MRDEMLLWQKASTNIWLRGQYLESAISADGKSAEKKTHTMVGKDAGKTMVIMLDGNAEAGRMWDR